MNHNCLKCGDVLIIGENITQSAIDNYYYICRKCHVAYTRLRRHQLGQCQPMNKNKTCPMFLGVVVAERVLSHIFKNVHKMPINNPGYDFICGRGYLVDVKSACRHQPKNKTDRWTFVISKNHVAEYFLCLAFDNRESLNPEHIWLIPAEDVRDRIGISIAETTLKKWDKYKRDITKVVRCCDALKENPNQ